ncbi:hypothetical protein NQ663_22255, partial [Acinetobacter baumannii]|nr:hypothetical protein [Acinetobacter baumannii]
TKQNAGWGVKIKVVHGLFPVAGKKSWWRRRQPDAAHCGGQALSSQFTFLPMSWPFLQRSGETVRKCAHC